jgi:hypothetical protein
MARQGSAEGHPVAQLVALILCRAAALLLLLSLYDLPTPANAVAGEQGVLEIQLTDHRDAIGDFAKLNITVEKILISPKSGLKFWHAGWQELIPTETNVDLTQFVDKKSASIYRSYMDAAKFDAFHLKIRTIEGVLKKNKRAAAVKNTVGPVKLAFEVRPQLKTLLIIDLIITDFSDHPPRGFELGLRGFQLSVGDKLIATVPPS